MELWDAYDKDFNKIEGMTLVRGEEAQIPDGVYHLVCDVFVRHADGTFLLMQRDPEKKHPLMWEASAGGSALKGESPFECGIRELREETGLETTKLTEVRRNVGKYNHSVYVGFFCETDCDKQSITLQEGETVDYRWVTKEELLSMGEDELLTKWAREFVEKSF